MATLWVVVYLLSLISTCKSKHPAIAPLASAFIVPWEIIITMRNIIQESNGVGYIVYTQCGWGILHFITVCIVLFVLKYYPPKKMIAYILFACAVGGLLLLIFTTQHGQLYTSYINTWIGILIWLFYARRSDYPLTKLNMAIAICKCVADTFGFIVYWRQDAIVFTVALLLPLTDAIHVVVLARAMYKRKIENKRKKYIM